MLRVPRTTFFVFAIAFSMVVQAGGPVSWKFTSVALGADTVQVQLHSNCAPGWHIYALNLPSDEGPLPTLVKVAEAPEFRMAGPVAESKPEQKMDPAFAMLVNIHGGEATFTQNVLRNSPKAFTIQGYVEYMACNDQTCLPPTREEFHLTIPPAQ